MFYLVSVDKDGKEFPLTDFDIFETGFLAGKKALELQAQGLYRKVQPRRIARADDWRARENEAIASGRVNQMPDGWILTPIPDHFARPEHGLIAYFARNEHGVINKLTRQNPGRYIREFYSDIGLDDVLVRQHAALITGAGDVLFAKTEDEIEWVYENGPTSCMTRAYHRNNGRPDAFHSQIHPVRVYAAGDLAVAYTKSKSGESVAERALCWPDRKVFGRVYGDGSQRLKKGLEELEFLPAKEEQFDGARLLRRLQTTQNHLYFVMPYLDAGHREGGGSRNFVDDGEYLKVAYHDLTNSMDGDVTSGLVQADYIKDGASRTADYVEMENAA